MQSRESNALSAARPLILRTARLVLRPPTLDDFAHGCAMWGDPDIVRYLGGKQNTGEEVWARLLRFIGHWCALGYGYWVAESLTDGAFCGVVGFSDFHREIEPRLDGLPEMGWVLNKASHGTGLATEAGREALRWRDQALPPGDTVCIIDPDNTASLRVAAKLGFQKAETTTHNGSPTIILRRSGAR
jgi:RimJ/RimL family protein N-acetyltransferase